MKPKMFEENELYVDELRSVKEVEEAFEVLKLAKAEEDREAFKNYSLEVMKALERGCFNRQTAAYAIAGCLSFTSLWDFEEISQILDKACDLELPHHVKFSSDEEYDQAWNEFERAIENL